MINQQCICAQLAFGSVVFMPYYCLTNYAFFTTLKTTDMRFKLWILPIICLYFLLISASTTSIEMTPVAADKEVVIEAPVIVKEKSAKLNFFQRALLKHVSKKYKTDEIDSSKADKQAKLALIFGLSAAGLLILGLFIPYVIFASLPAAIAAMVLGGAALRGRTKYVGKARNGKGFGLGALIGFGVVLLAAILFVAAWGF